MPNGDNEKSSRLIDLITSVAMKVFKTESKRIPREWVAQVITASVAPNAIAQVYLNSDVTSTPISVKNKSWETLVAGDEVYLHSPSGSLSDVIILYSK